jgi:hypothetical protein
MNYEKLKATVTDEVKKRILNASLDFINEFRFHDSDDPTEVITQFDNNYNNAVSEVIRAVLEGVRDGINQAGDTAFNKCISKAVANGDLSEERADIVSNEYDSYESMELNGIVDNYFNQ